MILKKLQRKWMKLRLQPIRVFCLHHVCEQFDADAMYACDWMALDEFKQKINIMRNDGYQFISITDAYEHLKKDKFRRKKYAILTLDDDMYYHKDYMMWMINAYEKSDKKTVLGQWGYIPTKKMGNIYHTTNG